MQSLLRCGVRVPPEQSRGRVAGAGVFSQARRDRDAPSPAPCSAPALTLEVGALTAPAALRSPGPAPSKLCAFPVPPRPSTTACKWK